MLVPGWPAAGEFSLSPPGDTPTARWIDCRHTICHMHEAAAPVSDPVDCAACPLAPPWPPQPQALRQAWEAPAPLPPTDRSEPPSHCRRLQCLALRLNWLAGSAYNARGGRASPFCLLVQRREGADGASGSVDGRGQQGKERRSAGERKAEGSRGAGSRNQGRAAATASRSTVAQHKGEG